jgi:putative transposase
LKRGEGRRAQRNVYKPRTQRTRVGTLELRVPQTRDGGFFPAVLERYHRSEGALANHPMKVELQSGTTILVRLIRMVWSCGTGEPPPPHVMP